MWFGYMLGIMTIPGILAGLFLLFALWGCLLDLIDWIRR